MMMCLELLSFQEAVSGCKPAHSSDVRPSVCGWACSLQKRDSTFCLESSTPSSREKQAPQLEACETGDSGKRQGVLEVHCYFYRMILGGCTQKQVGFPGGASGKEMPADAGDMRDEDSIPGSGRSWRRAQQPTLECLPGESHGQRSLVGQSMGSQSQTRLQ